MNREIKRPRLFNACSLALVVTALTFAIRANLLGTFGTEFGLTPTEIGQTAAAAFWGFTFAMFFGGPLCDFLGMGRMYLLAFIGHMVGIVLTIFATGYWSLFISTLLVGLANGLIESASYSMVSSMYPQEKAMKIIQWHIWFPAGIVIGGVVSYICTLFNTGWRFQILTMIPPILAYGAMFFRQTFPKSERVMQGVSNKEMVRECFRPLFIFMAGCMLLTAATECGTNQWIAELLSTVGVPSILLLVFINGIMTVGRANARFVLKHLSPSSILLISAALSTVGLVGLGHAKGYAAFVPAGVFAAGVCFFWPTMISFVAENLPRTGPLGLSLMGGVGLLSISSILPYFGQVYEWRLASQTVGISDLATLREALPGTSEALRWSEIKLEAGAQTLQVVAVLPALLTIAFGLLCWKGRKQTTKNEHATD